ncbi:tonB-system energizer ExbB [Pseudolabrys sp.]|uniref:tonB-system energizer ExbB n=1 Tax=Pseudolabrys sp. TaxID=1960880 RepID=UPI003D1524AD
MNSVILHFLRRHSAAIMLAAALLPAAALAQTSAPPPSTPASPPPAVTTPAAPAQSTPAQSVTPAAPATPAPAANPASTAAPGDAAAPAAPGATAPAVPAPGAAPSAVPSIALTLPRDLSPWGMFMQADIVVKAVMVGLAFASLLTWTIWFAKALEIFGARARLRSDMQRIENAPSLIECTQTFGTRRSSASMLVHAAMTEIEQSADAIDREGVKERVASRLERLEAAAARRMIRGTGPLATIGATAPFVGLFGTVWGIMNSFIGISKSQTTNLAVVAPGIAEALLATALGLVAAIPAVVMYNLLSRWTAGYRAQYGDASAAVLRLVSRDLDRELYGRRTGHRPRAAAE